MMDMVIRYDIVENLEQLCRLHEMVGLFHPVLAGPAHDIHYTELYILQSYTAQWIAGYVTSTSTFI